MSISNQQLIKQSLLRGERLTVCGCAAKYMTGDLRKYISNLRKEGMDIKDVEKVSRKNGRYKEYYIN